MGREDFERFYDLDKKINETVEREVEIAEDGFFNELFLDEDIDKPQEPKRRRGRPRGVKESIPRKRKSKLVEIRERLNSAIQNIRRLEEVL